MCLEFAGDRAIRDHADSSSSSGSRSRRLRSLRSLRLPGAGHHLCWDQSGKGEGLLQQSTPMSFGLQGRGEGRQIKRCDVAYVNGTGGMMAEQVAVILEGT